MGLIAGLLGLACAATPEPVAAVPSPAAETVRVVAVPMNGSGGVPPACRLPFGEAGQPCADTGVLVPLTHTQAAALSAVLADPATWGGAEGKTALPLHGFAWLDAGGAVQGQIAVSLLTERVDGAPDVPGQPTDPATRGLSEAGVVALRAVCVELGLPHCHVTSPAEAFGR